MKARLTVFALLLTLALPAAAQITTVALAHEVRLSDLRLPQSDGGTIGFRACETCEFQTERVTAATRWIVNGERTSLKEFRESVAEAGDKNLTYATVLHHLRQDRITEVAVFLR